MAHYCLGSHLAQLELQTAIGALSDWFAGRTLIGTGLAMQAAGLAWLGIATTPTTSYPAFIGPFLLAGAGMGLFFAPLANVVLSAVRPAQQGQASGPAMIGPATRRTPGRPDHGAHADRRQGR